MIPRKDLPRIYTTCVPGAADSAPAAGSARLQPLTAGDLDAAREEILDHVAMAPARRVDNDVTRLYDASRMLLMHARMLDAVRRGQRAVRRGHALRTAGIAGLGGAAAAAGYAMDPALMLGFSSGLAAASAALAAGYHAWNAAAVSARQAEIASDDGLKRLLRSQYHLELAASDEFVLSLWERVRPQLRVALSTVDVQSLPEPSSAEMARLQEICDVEVPRMRRATSAVSALPRRRGAESPAAAEEEAPAAAAAA